MYAASTTGEGAARPAVMFDFDSAVTSFDVLDAFIRRFAVDKRWAGLMRKRRAGAIGSRECLEGQLRSLRVTRRQAEEYLDGIRVDPWFNRIVSYLSERGSPPVLVSDSFYFFIDRILKNSGITGLKIFSNQARFHRDKIIPLFSDQNRSCYACANCKKRYVTAHARQHRLVLYVGGGISDVCPARAAMRVYARAELARRLKREGQPFVPFATLEEVYAHLRAQDGAGTISLPRPCR